MTLIDALSSLAAMRVPVFETGDAAVRLSLTNAHASTVLARLAAARQVVRLRRGVWAFPDRVDPLTLPGRLTAPLPSYVSLQSALYFHGMISQVPAVTYAVSLARARRFDTPLGVVSVHHVTPGFFFGFEDTGRQGAFIASPEKALVDFLYLAPARSKLFRALPEVELPRGFSRRLARAMTGRIESARRRVMVARALERVLAPGLKTRRIGLGPSARFPLR
jgi:predicted transcriptional regulator of viral defense system